MNLTKIPLAGLALAGLALLLIAACSLPEAMPDLTRFYVLTPTGAVTGTGADATSAEESAGTEPRRVYVRSVIVPEFLRGKIMQVRSGDNEMKFIDTARWAEPLEPGVTRVLRENLSKQPASVQVIGRAGDAHDVDVVVRLQHFEGALPDGVARVGARVEIYSAALEPKLVAEDEFFTEIPGWNGNDYGQLASKLSEGAAALSARILTLLPAAPLTGR